MNQSAARFKSDTTIYTPHGLGVAYSNDNLTDKAARAILKADPDAAALFDVLPGEADDSATVSTNSAPAATSAGTSPSDAEAEQVLSKLSDSQLDKLAEKLFGRLKSHVEQNEAAPADAHPATHLGIDGEPVAPGLDPTTTTLSVAAPSLTASTGGALDVSTTVEPNGVEVTTGHVETVEEKRVRLSRMTTAQLVAAYRSELLAEPDAALTNDQLRQAISDHRVASVASPATPDAGTSLV